MKKTVIFLVTILICIKSFGQSTISPDGLVFPNKSLISTTDVVTVPSPVVGQSVYNTNAGITGAGASGVGFYSWNGTLWTNGASPVPAGGIVLSTIHPNSALISAGFSLLGSYVVPNFSTYNAACNVFTPTNLSAYLPSNGNGIPADFKLHLTGNKLFVSNTYQNGKNVVDILDVSTDTWVTRASFNYEIALTGGVLSKSSTFTLLGSQLYVWGGQVYNSTSGTFTPNTKLLKFTDEVNNIWTDVPFTLPVGFDSRELTRSIAYGSKIIVFGGVQSGTTVKNDGFIIDPVAGTSTALTPPVGFVARTLPKLYIINNKLIIFGGFRSFSFSGGYNFGTGGELCDGIMYDFGTSTWTNISTTNAPAFNNANTRSSWRDKTYIFEEFNNKLYYVGFDGNATTYTIERKIFDPATNTWTNFLGTSPTLPFRMDFNGKIANGHLIMQGGASATTLSDGAIYDLASGTWSNFDLGSGFARRSYQMQYVPINNSFYMSGRGDSMGYGTQYSKLPDPCFSTPTSTTFYMYNK